MSSSGVGSSSSRSNEPPQPNPLLTAYESFVKNTPFVTRIILTIQVISYAFSWFMVNPTYSLGNIPLFSIQYFELYRILLSPLINDSFITLIFTFWSFQPLGQRLELSMGSTAFGWLCFMQAFAVNIIFILVSYFLYALTGSKPYVLAISHGMWTILFGIIALECVRAPAGTKRTFFFGTQVPVRYYPVALYLVFAILAFDFSLANLISIGLGYLVGFGDSTEASSWSFYFRTIAGACKRLILLPAFRAQQWEDRYLSGFANMMPGWVGANACLGLAAWNSENLAASSSSGLVCSLCMTVVFFFCVFL